MTELELTWKRVLGVTWSVVWRSAVFTLIGSIALSLVLSISIGLFEIVTANEIQDITRKIINAIMSILLSFLIFLLAMKIALKKQYSDFRIAIVGLENE